MGTTAALGACLAASHWNPIVAAACAAMVFAVAALYALRAVLVRLGGDVAIGAAALVINVVALAASGTMLFELVRHPLPAVSHEASIAQREIFFFGLPAAATLLARFPWGGRRAVAWHYVAGVLNCMGIAHALWSWSGSRSLDPPLLTKVGLSVYLLSLVSLMFQTSPDVGLKASASARSWWSGLVLTLRVGLVAVSIVAATASVFVTSRLFARLEKASVMGAVASLNGGYVDASTTATWWYQLWHKDDDKRAVYIRLESAILKRDDFAAFDWLHGVAELDLGYARFTNDGLSHLQQLDIGALILTESTLDDSGCAHLAKIRSVDRLYLGGTAITDVGIRRVMGLKSLSVLSLGYSPRRSAADTTLATDRLLEVGDPSSEWIGKMDFGDQFRPSNIVFSSDSPRPAPLAVTDAGLEPIGALTALRSLDLADAPVTDASLERLMELAAIEHLSLYHTGITDASLAALSRLRRLIYLDLRRTDTTEAGVRKFIKDAGRPVFVLK
jgi:hypothetical protein